MNVRFIAPAAFGLFLQSGCNGLAQKDKSALEATAPATPPGARAFQISTDTIAAFIPEVIHEMPPMRGRPLAELVDFSSLAALLPDSLPNMKRDDIVAERAIEDSILVALAAGSYADRDGNHIAIKITDPGNPNVFAASHYPWLTGNIQSETENSYERTMTFAGYRGFTRYYLKDHSGEMYFIVGERFVVEATGYGVLDEDLKNAASHIDLRKLESLHARN